jgi:rubrerythrin
VTARLTMEVLMAGKRQRRNEKVTKAEITEEIVEPTLHGMTDWGLPPTVICPECMYAFADGGHCPDCGWTDYTPRDPYGTNSGGHWEGKTNG